MEHHSVEDLGVLLVCSLEVEMVVVHNLEHLQGEGGVAGTEEDRQEGTREVSLGGHQLGNVSAVRCQLHWNSHRGVMDGSAVEWVPPYYDETVWQAYPKTYAHCEVQRHHDHT